VIRRLVAAAAVAMLLAGSSCDSPRGTQCGSDGSRMFSSKHGEFVCRNGYWVPA
jgi:hypothetical protein